MYMGSSCGVTDTNCVSEHIFDLPSKLFPIIQHKYFNTTQIYLTSEIMWKIWATNGVLIVHKPFTEVTRPVSLVENITFPCSWEATVRIPSSIRLEQETFYGRSSLSNKPSLHKSCHKSIIWLKSTNVERKDSIHFKAQSAAVHLSGLCCSVITPVFMNQCVHRCNLGDCNRARFRSLTWNNTEVNFQFKIRAEDHVWERVRQGIHFAVVQYWAPNVKRELFRRPERGGERQRWCLLRTL